MRAVNLIPKEVRSGGGAGAGGRSGGAAYLLLGGMAVLAIMAVVWGLTASAAGTKQAELDQLHLDAARAAAGAAGLASTQDIKSLRSSRTAAVTSLAQQRIDWAATLEELGRALPADTTLMALDASATGKPANVNGAAPAAPGAVAPAGPTLEMSGCAPSQRAVAWLIPRLRTVPGVTGVQLVTSSVDPGGDKAAGGASSTAAACTGAAFQMVLSLAAPAGPGAIVPAAAGVTAAAAVTPAPVAQTAVPASSTSTSGAGQ